MVVLLAVRFGDACVSMSQKPPTRCVHLQQCDTLDPDIRVHELFLSHHSSEPNLTLAERVRGLVAVTHVQTRLRAGNRCLCPNAVHAANGVMQFTSSLHLKRCTYSSGMENHTVSSCSLPSSQARCSLIPDLAEDRRVALGLGFYRVWGCSWSLPGVECRTVGSQE